MRADRLLSLLLLLQTNGQMTAGQLATELEVSERTIYRDIDALSVAGIPLYADRGPDGGFALIDSYRTTLTGLTEGELRALFLLSIPAPVNDLGLSKELRSALLKLSASLPDARRSALQEVRQRVYLDAVWWFQGGETVPHLQTIQEAVWQDRLISIVFRQQFGVPVEMEQVVAPYGIVAKAGVWYLVYSRVNVVRVRRVSHLIDVGQTDETFARPDNFDLELFWRRWCRDYEENRPHYPVLLRVAPHFMTELTRSFDNRIHIIPKRSIDLPAPMQEGWETVEIVFESLQAARASILGYGAAVEILAPLPLRLSVRDFAEQIVNVYKT